MNKRLQNPHFTIVLEVPVHHPSYNQTAKNLARLDFSVDRTIAENRKETSRDTEKEILYKLLAKLTPLSFCSWPWQKMKKTGSFQCL